MVEKDPPLSSEIIISKSEASAPYLCATAIELSTPVYYYIFLLSRSVSFSGFVGRYENLWQVFLLE